MSKLKDDLKKVIEQRDQVRNDFEVYKSNDGLSSAQIMAKSEIENINTDDLDINLKELLKKQIEENRKFREMLSKFIDHKNKNVLIGKSSNCLHIFD